MTKPSATLRILGVLVLAGLTVLPTLTSRMSAPANYGGHGLTSGFGRGRLDLSGIVSDGKGGSVDLPLEPASLTVVLSGAGLIQLRGAGVDQAIVGSEIPTTLRVEMPKGGRLSITSASRIRLHELVVERSGAAFGQTSALGLLGILALLVSARGLKPALIAAGGLGAAFHLIASGTLSSTFARIAMARLAPTLFVVLLLLPLILALKEARFPGPRGLGRWGSLAFALSLALTTLQLLWFDQPLLMGDPQSYFEMGGRFAEALAGIRSPLDLGPALSEVQAYLALPATGLLYGLLRLLGGGLGLIYAAQAVAMAAAVGALVSICEDEMGARAGKVALVLALLHPSFSILPGIVQPEPFILAAWTLAALTALRARRSGNETRGFLAAGLLLGLGLALHPQGLSFLLLALGFCVAPWAPTLARRPRFVIAPVLGILSVLLPTAAAEHFARPLGHVLDRQYGFFAFTSPHPLGFWLYLDSDGWQGPLRIEDTSYQKELINLKGDAAASSSFADVAFFMARHPAESLRTVLTNLHRLWRQPDNPFAVPFGLPFEAQILLHRALVVLFVVSLPALLSGPLAVLVLPFAMLSMTYPAYHVFNKYATPALPFTIMGAAFAIDRLWEARARSRVLLAGLAGAAAGALLPATAFARLGLSGDLFLILVRGLLWLGLAVALWSAVSIFGRDIRARLVAFTVGFMVLLASSWSAALTDTDRGAWSVSLERPLELSCHLPFEATPEDPSAPQDPAWLLVDARSSDATPPQVRVNGRPLEPVAPMMPTYGLAGYRGHRDPAGFRQMWRAPIGEDLLADGELSVQVSGGRTIRVFGDIREGSDGPRLSIGNWPHLSVYRLMHEGQYRLPVRDAPAQACSARGLSGRPGVNLVRIPEGEETLIALKSPKPPTWIF